ncbi:MAG: iron ABC transporter permease [Phycisphaerae bacterium]
MSPRVFSASRFAKHVGAGVVVVALLIAISPGIGSQPIGVIEAWKHWSDTDSSVYYIAFQLRLPAALKALVAGFSLSLAGAAYQTLFRNVLATPYTLGIASGGSLGALMAFKFGLTGVMLGLPGEAWCAFLGCSVVVALVFLMAGSRHRIAGNTLVLGGVTIGLFCSAMMMFVTYLADVRETFFIVRWMMGSLETVGHVEVPRILIPLSVSWLVLFAYSRSLNQFDLGEEMAASRGVRPATIYMTCIGSASLATACIVSICGPIGFVGLIVPQAVRLVLGRDHRLLLPTAALWGGAFLIVCNWLTHLVPGWYSRLVGLNIAPFPLPIGVMTAVIGAPVFMFMLWHRGRP